MPKLWFLPLKCECFVDFRDFCNRKEYLWTAGHLEVLWNCDNHLSNADIKSGEVLQSTKHFRSFAAKQL